MKLGINAWLAGVLCAAGGGAQPQDYGVPTNLEEVASLDLEQLLEVRVSSASRKEETVFETAAAIQALGNDDIRRLGVTLLPDVLRYAAGTHVAQYSSRGWAISIRGFNEDSANKLEALMDGRSVYTPFFSGALWDHVDYVLEDVERVEVIRGPGATMWGANAVNGVINIYTKGSEDTVGALLQTTIASPERYTLSARLGFQLDEKRFARVYAKYYALDDMQTASGERSAFDSAEMLRVGFRTDYLPDKDTRLLVEGEIFTDKIGLAHDEYSFLDGGYLLARWERRFDSEREARAQGYYDRYDRLYLGAFHEVRETVELSGQLRYQGLRNQDWVGGATFRYSWDDTERVSIPYLEPAKEGFAVASVFAQNEIDLPGLGKLSLGATLEHNSLIDRIEFQPSLRYLWQSSAQRATWVAVSRAARTPARADTDLRWVQPDFELSSDRQHKSEIVSAYELGQRFRWGEALSLETSLFYNRYGDLPTVEPLGSGRYGYSNLQEGETWGGELTVEYRPNYWSRYTLSWAHLQQSFSLKPGSQAEPISAAAGLGNDPENLATLSSVFELPRATELSAHLRYVDELALPAVPDYLVMDLRVSWAPRPGLELALVGRNLLDHRHPEFHQESPFRREISRSVEFHARIEF